MIKLRCKNSEKLFQILRWNLKAVENQTAQIHSFPPSKAVSLKEI
ncbi:hypothetical protein C723_2624 [Christiangramia flava JLT2011]|uniref:Uncharacterized protein n=1 Tax=Christiangramia flava JLT2011 TaxID=1229726 RepID=A0A1L7HZI5_9FLAO|nr:hypothetical protein GRFL_0026 [Christiangramia flava JLT2011]OSS38387.1 hypothetical protein C723_2624 [Christiangramia flava JLT2011]